MTNNEARERIAEEIRLVIANAPLNCAGGGDYQICRPVFENESQVAQGILDKLYSLGYRLISPEKLTVLSSCPCPDCEIFLHVIPSQLLEQAEIKRQKPCHSDCDKWRTWVDQLAQLEKDRNTIKEIGE